MLKISDILITGLRQQMDFYKRNASGQAVESLQERVTSDGVQIVGIDYFEQIFKGTPKGTIVPLQDIIQWKNAKQGRYGVNLPSAKAIKTKIYSYGAPTKKEGLDIDNKVLKIYAKPIDTEIRNHVNKLIFK